jgi:hypothetical protein
MLQKILPFYPFFLATVTFIGFSYPNAEADIQEILVPKLEELPNPSPAPNKSSFLKPDESFLPFNSLPCKNLDPKMVIPNNTFDDNISSNMVIPQSSEYFTNHKMVIPCQK